MSRTNFNLFLFFSILSLVIPDQPTDLIIDQTSDSAKLSWIIPLDLQNIDRSKFQKCIYTYVFVQSVHACCSSENKN